MADLSAPRLLYRSRLFWLGVPGFMFLIWGGLAFRGRTVDVWCEVHYYSINLVVFDGYLAGQYMDFTPIRHKRGSSPWVWHFEDRIGGTTYRGPIFKMYALPKNGMPNAINSYALQAQLWFLTLLYLFAWLGTLTARQRRKARGLLVPDARLLR